MKYVQEYPNVIQVESTEGCNLACTFCGINGIREKNGGPFKFMTPAIANKIASDMAKAGWTSRIEFAMHGEPSMNPDLPKLIAAFRTHLPRCSIMLTSNGGGFLKFGPVELAKALFDAGLNTIAFDDYQSVKIVPKLRERLKPWIKEQKIPWYEYPRQVVPGNPHARMHAEDRRVVAIADISVATKGNHSRLNNHTGCAAPKDYSAMGKRCAKPFREMAIRWDGGVSYCCDDWRGYAKVGNVTKQSIDAIWHAPVMYAIRRKLYRGQRDFGPCHGCNELSYRVGLLPDKLGKKSLPKPDKNDERLIKNMLRGPSMSPVVLRPWEKKLASIPVVVTSGGANAGQGDDQR